MLNLVRCFVAFILLFCVIDTAGAKNFSRVDVGVFLTDERKIAELYDNGRADDAVEAAKRLLLESLSSNKFFDRELIDAYEIYASYSNRLHRLNADTLDIMREYNALALRVLEPDSPKALMASTMLAKNYLALDRIDEAFALLSEADKHFSIDDDGAGAYYLYSFKHSLATYFFKQRAYESALKEFSTARRIAEKFLKGHTPDLQISLNNIGLTLQKLNRLDEAIDIYRQIEAMAEAEKKTDSPELLATKINIAAIHYSLNRFGQAAQEFEALLPLSNLLHGYNSPTTATLLNNLGVVFSRSGNYEKGVDYHLKALDLRKKLFGVSSVVAANSHANLAKAYLTLDDKRAVEHAQKALAIREEKWGKDYPDRALDEIVLAQTYEQASLLDDASDIYDSILETENAVALNDATKLIALTRRASIAKQKGKLDEATFFIKQAISINVKFSEQGLKNAFAEAAEIFQLKGESSQALQYSNIAVSFAWEEFAEMLSNKPDISPSYVEPNIHLLESHLSRLLSQPLSEQVKEDAFLYSQILRLSETSISHWKGISKTSSSSELTNLKYRKQLLELKLSKLNSELFKQINNLEFDELLTQDLNKANKQLAEISEKIKSIEESEDVVAMVSISDVQSVLEENEVFVTFNIIDNIKIVWAISRDEAVVKHIRNAVDIDSMVSKLNSGLRLNESGRLAETPIFNSELSHKLYDVLFTPIFENFEHVEELILVPDKTLKALPVNALISNLNDQSVSHFSEFSNYGKMTWLIDAVSVSSVSTAANFLKIRTQGYKNKAGLLSFSGIGAPISKTTNSEGAATLRAGKDEISALPELKNAKQELQRQAELFENRSSLLLGKSATIAATQNALEKSNSVVSFATHLVEGDESGLLLSSDEAFTLLTADAISSFDIRADVVLLAACDTTRFEIAQNSLYSPLINNLLRSGAQTVVATQWNVEDEAISRISVEMLENALSKGHSISKSLSLSMRSFKASNKNTFKSHPAFWAPAVIIGDNRVFKR